MNAEATVRHVRPPAITSITATPDVLWPANNQMVRVSVDVGVSDDSDPAPACRITGVTSNESIVGTGWQMTGPLTVDLLAQRFGVGDRTHLHADRHLHEQLGAQFDGDRECQCAARSGEGRRRFAWRVLTPVPPSVPRGDAPRRSPVVRLLGVVLGAAVLPVTRAGRLLLLTVADRVYTSTDHIHVSRLVDSSKPADRITSYIREARMYVSSK